MKELTGTEIRISETINNALDDVIEWLSTNLTERDRNLINLAANATIHRLTVNEDDEMDEVVEASYSEEPEVVWAWFE